MHFKLNGEMADEWLLLCDDILNPGVYIHSVLLPGASNLLPIGP